MCVYVCVCSAQFGYFRAENVFYYFLVEAKKNTYVCVYINKEFCDKSGTVYNIQYFEGVLVYAIWVQTENEMNYCVNNWK